MACIYTAAAITWLKRTSEGAKCVQAEKLLITIRLFPTEEGINLFPRVKDLVKTVNLRMVL
ncbi:MAG: hypothetical protein LBC30_04130 [Puniceicoccales bacterium]|nr:hypothetical protein [Puniceicoccales bacterium]